jgi:hypothetical protein
MANGTQTFMFSFGPLSGLTKISNGQPGTDFPNEFNVVYTDTPQLLPGDPATTDGASDSPAYSVGSGGTANAPFTYHGPMSRWARRSTPNY